MCRTFRQREVLQIDSLLNTHSLNGNTCALWSKTFPYNFEIRQRLLENNELTLDQAFDIANSFDMALEHSAAYLSYEKGLSAAAAVTPGDNLHANGSHCDSGSSCTIPPKSRKCSFCAKAYHERDHCPARDAICCLCVNP